MYNLGTVNEFTRLTTCCSQDMPAVLLQLSPALSCQRTYASWFMHFLSDFMRKAPRCLMNTTHTKFEHSNATANGSTHASQMISKHLMYAAWRHEMHLDWLTRTELVYGIYIIKIKNYLYRCQDAKYAMLDCTKANTLWTRVCCWLKL